MFSPAPTAGVRTSVSFPVHNLEIVKTRLTQQVAELDGLLLQRRRGRETCGCGHNLGVVVCVRALTKGDGCFVAKGWEVRCGRGSVWVTGGTLTQAKTRSVEVL
jgi:hypothetical protein